MVCCVPAWPVGVAACAPARGSGLAVPCPDMVPWYWEILPCIQAWVAGLVLAGGGVGNRPSTAIFRTILLCDRVSISIAQGSPASMGCSKDQDVRTPMVLLHTPLPLSYCSRSWSMLLVSMKPSSLLVCSWFGGSLGAFSSTVDDSTCSLSLFLKLHTIALV